jgi:hypothetical protein
MKDKLCKGLEIRVVHFWVPKGSFSATRIGSGCVKNTSPYRLHNEQLTTTTKTNISWGYMLLLSVSKIKLL